MKKNLRNLGRILSVITLLTGFGANAYAGYSLSCVGGGTGAMTQHSTQACAKGGPSTSHLYGDDHTGKSCGCYNTGGNTEHGTFGCVLGNAKNAGKYDCACYINEGCD